MPVYPSAADPTRAPRCVAEMRHSELVGWGVRFDLQDKAREKAANDQRKAASRRR